MKIILPFITFIIGFCVAYIIYMPQDSFIDKLHKKGVYKENIHKLVLIGDEFSNTTNMKKVIEAKDDIYWIWDNMFTPAVPYSKIELSGNRQIEVYTKNNIEKPAINLFVNATDATSIEKDEDLYICSGLESLIINSLKQK